MPRLVGRWMKQCEKCVRGGTGLREGEGGIWSHEVLLTKSVVLAFGQLGALTVHDYQLFKRPNLLLSQLSHWLLLHSKASTWRFLSLFLLRTL